MIPLNYTADSKKPIAIPVDLKPPHRDSDMAHIAADSTWLWRLTGSVGGEPSARRDRSCTSRQLRRTAEMGGFRSSSFGGLLCPYSSKAVVYWQIEVVGQSGR